MTSILALLDPTTLLLGGVLVLCVLWWLSTRRSPGLPPGPGPALPLLGHLYLMPNDPRAQLMAWKHQYGDVFSLYLGGRLVVVLASYSAIREAFVTCGDAFSDRPHVFLFDHMFKTKGVIGSSGTRWKEQRKIALEILRAMGMGKNVLADKIQEEITHYIRAIKDHQGAPMDITRMTQVSVSNVMCSIALGKRFDYSDSDFISYLDNMDDFLKYTAGSSILNYLPFLGYLPGDPFKRNHTLANIDAVWTFTGKHVADHRDTLEEGGEVGDTDFIFSYLRQIRDLKNRGVVDTTVDGSGWMEEGRRLVTGAPTARTGYGAKVKVELLSPWFSEDSLRNVVNDLFLAGTETTANVLRWAFVFLIRHPRVQDKCFQEISDVVGPHRPPSMSDKAKLTYLEATLSEVMRARDVLPLILHSASRDVKFRSYTIPKDTVIMADHDCVLQDPEIWGDPENFRPERFIGPDGKLIKQDVLIAFGMGRRVCLGEAMSRMELFLYLATLIQHFRFLPPEEGQLPSLEGVFGQTLVPHPYKIRAVPRA